MRARARLLVLVVACTLSAGAAAQQAGESAPPSAGARSLVLQGRTLPGTDVRVLEGGYEVFEDRDARRGRKIELKIRVLPASGSEPLPDPIFVLAGGPGQAASVYGPMLANSWMRAARDIVMVDQRGTGESNPLRCDLPGGPDDPAGYLAPLFDDELFRACLEALGRRADLRLYTTPIAMDDLDEVREALGYDRINLIGGSYGTRAALVYMRRHPETVRCAVLKGVAPIGFRNPLYHPWGAQQSLDGLLAACAADPDCHAAFPKLAEELAAVFARLEKAPAVVEARRASGGQPVRIPLTRRSLAEALRVMLYSSGTARLVPLRIREAFLGHYLPFVQQAIAGNRRLREQLAFGMLLCVTCAEDVARIDPGEVAAATAGTFLGEARVRDQMRVCSFWPRGRIPEDYGEPVSVEVPALIFTGTLDPVTGPRWGEEAARHLPHSLHVVVPGFHDYGQPCVGALVREFLEAGSAADLDTSCVERMRLTDFELPED